MFNTFVAVQSPRRSVSVSSEASKSKVKRKQVARACTLCRLNRTKCDEYIPCLNCKVKGSSCSKSGSINARTLSAANREIDTLRAKLELVESASNNSPPIIGHSSPPSPPYTTTPASLCSPDEAVQGRKRKSWPALRTQDPSTGNIQYYGPSSSFVFLDRTSSFLSSVLCQSLSASDLLPTMVKTPEIGFNDEAHTHLEMPHRQQECLLNLFWQTYHCLMPVVCEQEFRELFELLWVDSLDPHSRHPSPLVDIMLALCIQYGHTFLKDPESSDSMDSKSAFYYNRSRSELAKEWEIPSQLTVQSYIFVAMYLQNISNLNAAHSAVDLAVRAAYTIGFHLEPPKDIPRPQQELRRRLWWGLYVLDTKLSLELGRPWAIDSSHVACALPVDDALLAHFSGPNFSFPLDQTNWLSFHLQNIKLAIATRSVHGKFYLGSVDIISSGQTAEIYKDPEALERCAELLDRSMEPLRSWSLELPQGLKSKRQDSGSPLSTDRTLLDVETSAPLWVQLQRVSLELSYHHFAATFQRPFIYFMPHSLSTTPLADHLAITSLYHCLTITNITHQVLTQFDTLAGWYGSYHILWDAALIMQGFAIAYPVCPPTPSARKSVNLAIKAFEIFKKDIPMAANAAGIMRNLNSKARLLMDQFRKALDVPTTRLSNAELMEAQSQTAQSWISSPSPWFGEVLNMPPSDGPVESLEADLQWPNFEQCNVEMWASFLNNLESSFPEIDRLENMDMGV